jgi:hypothetical protein
MNEEEIQAKAEKRVEEKVGFRTHLTVYLIVNTLLFFIWLFTSLFAADGWIFPWFLFPLIGWGIGIAFHAWGVYGPNNSEARREAMVQKEMERIKRESGEE